MTNDLLLCSSLGYIYTHVNKVLLSRICCLQENQSFHKEERGCMEATQNQSLLGCCWETFFSFLGQCLVTKSCPTLCSPMNCSTPGFLVLHHGLEFAQTQVHWLGDAIQPSHPLSSPSPPAFNLSQHQGLFKWVSSLRQVAKGSELQLQHQSFQWIFTVDFP